VWWGVTKNYNGNNVVIKGGFQELGKKTDHNWGAGEKTHGKKYRKGREGTDGPEESG